MTKTAQLQVRLSEAQKERLKRLADLAGQDVSSYVLSRALPSHRIRFEELLEALHGDDERRFAVAELSDFLASITRDEFVDATFAPLTLPLPPYWQNYIAALLEQAAHLKGAPAPPWLADIDPLAEPRFGAPLRSLRVHLLRAAPVPFRRRNIFVDSGVDARV